MNYMLGLIFITLSNSALACPTCIGRLTHGSPVFFSDEHYTPTETDSESSNSLGETENTEKQNSNEERP